MAVVEFWQQAFHCPRETDGGSPYRLARVTRHCREQAQNSSCGPVLNKYCKVKCGSETRQGFEMRGLRKGVFREKGRGDCDLLIKIPSL